MMGPRNGRSGTPPRVVHLIHALNRRTLAVVATVLADEMHDLGCEAAVLAVKGMVERGPAGMGSVPSGVHAEVVGRDSTWRTTGALPAVRAALRRLAPDAVFAHGNGPIRAAVLATRFSGDRPRVVGIEHNHYSSYNWNLPRTRRSANRLLLPRTDAIAGVSGGVVEDLEATFPALTGRVALLPPPLTRYADIERFAAEPVDHPWFDDDVPIVATVGHVHPRKDHRTLVRAMARIRDVGGARAARLVIIGSASQGGEAAAVRSLVDELGLTQQVAMLGEQSNPLRFVARSTVFALSSRNEGMPVSILEAMAVGVPVVSTDCPSGPRWILEDGAHGLLVPVGDHLALGDAILQMLGDPDLRHRLSTWGPTRAADFSPATIAGQYLALAGLAT
jgi:glycosyltransferase involved in cell wall biosynthesis